MVSILPVFLDIKAVIVHGKPAEKVAERGRSGAHVSATWFGSEPSPVPIMNYLFIQVNIVSTFDSESAISLRAMALLGSGIS